MAETDKQVEFFVADNPQELFANIVDYDVLYIAAGEDRYLAPYHQHLDNLFQALEGKVYIGSSQGAYVAAENYMLSIDREDEARPHQ
jgi:peptidase E